MPKLKQYQCCLCFKRCKENSRRHIPPGLAYKRYIQERLGRQTHCDDVICGSCFSRVYRSLPHVQHVQQDPEEDLADPDFIYEPKITNPSSPKTVHLNIPAASRSHKWCVICHKDSSRRNHIINIPSTAITQAFINCGVFIHPKSRCCYKHLENTFFSSDALHLLRAAKTSDMFSHSDVVNLLTNIRKMLRADCHRLNFDIPAFLSDEDYETLTGITKDQFNDLVTYLEDIRNTEIRSKRTCLGVFLTKLRTGLSNKVLGVLHGLTAAQVQRTVTTTRQCLMSSFVPSNLGFSHLSHEDFATLHCTETAKTLFREDDSNAVVVLDGTYIYIQKSCDYQFQRRTYSTHKNRSLLKPMMIVGTDGYILEVLGPYYADGSNSDASITKHFLTCNEDSRQWFRDGDVFLVDRGFRDAVEFLEENNISVKMPPFLKKKEKQHSTEDANLSRMITKVRWIVEAVNGRIKKWKLLDKVLPNTLVPSIGDFVRITCSLCNKYRPPIAINTEEDVKWANEMLNKAKQPNQLLELLTTKNLLRTRSTFSLVDSQNLCNFPSLSLEDLRNITMGVYQIHQAPFYVKEHLDEDGTFQLMVHKESDSLIKLKIQSRHSQSVSHTLWIQYTPEQISGWYCTCKVGARVVGCCAHIASALWYLGYERHEAKHNSGVDINTTNIDDARHRVVSVSDSESDQTMEEE
ncbi:uncharacterized protein LOC128167586 [Crassostrea angulata]|nr:uncharacterized protein LOC128167586 [Crassostrea angulata]